MEQKYLNAEQLSAYKQYLKREERSAGTIEKYLRDVRAFAKWLAERPLSKEETAGWKEHLRDQGYAPVTVNSMLAALNGLCRFLGREDCRVKFLKIQRRLFREERQELTRQDYIRLLETAEIQGQKRLALLMKTICATGIRVSEVRYITVEAAERGRAEITLKGKVRTILIPGKLGRQLLKYAKKQKIASGEIFLTRSGKSLSRRQIWAEMKALCKFSDISPSKVFPHNLRHLFAAVFYRACKDIVRLADVLGHSSIETTRIYLISTGAEHARTMEQLHLVL